VATAKVLKQSKCVAGAGGTGDPCIEVALLLEAMTHAGNLRKGKGATRQYELNQMLERVALEVNATRDDPFWREGKLRHLPIITGKTGRRKSRGSTSYSLEMVTEAAKLPGVNCSRFAAAGVLWNQGSPHDKSGAAAFAADTSASGSSGSPGALAVESSAQRPVRATAKLKEQVNHKWHVMASYNTQTKDEFGPGDTGSPGIVGLHWDGVIRDGEDVESVLAFSAKVKKYGWMPTAVAWACAASIPVLVAFRQVRCRAVQRARPLISTDEHGNVHARSFRPMSMATCTSAHLDR
jgi:hypothetical protein